MIGFKQTQAGQVGLVVLLVMVVLLTVGVSVASRSVSELKLSELEQESTRALNLAETGVEDALSKDLSVLVPEGTTPCNPSQPNIDPCRPKSVSNVNYLVDSTKVITGMHVDIGHTIEVNLKYPAPTPTPSPQTLTVNWKSLDTDGNGCNSAAIEVSVINNVYGVKRYTFTGCNNGGTNTRGDNFSPVTSWDPGNQVYSAVINFDHTKDVIARVKVLYAGTDLSISGSPDLPVQVYTITSTAQLEDRTSRVVQVNKLASSLPSVFDYVLFSGGTIVK